MYNKRSYHAAESALTLAQRRRSQRDLYYCTSHSCSGRTFVEVKAELAPQVKAMARAKERHSQRESAIGTSTHYARNATLIASRAGGITQGELRNDLKIYRDGNHAKHSSSISLPLRQGSWADAVEDYDDEPNLGTTASGEYDPIFCNDPWSAAISKVTSRAEPSLASCKELPAASAVDTKLLIATYVKELEHEVQALKPAATHRQPEQHDSLAHGHD